MVSVAVALLQPLLLMLMLVGSVEGLKRIVCGMCGRVVEAAANCWDAPKVWCAGVPLSTARRGGVLLLICFFSKHKLHNGCVS